MLGTYDGPSPLLCRKYICEDTMGSALGELRVDLEGQWSWLLSGAWFITFFVLP